MPMERFLIRHRGAHLFDEEFYTQHNPDVLESHLRPIDHYLRYGWNEGRPVNRHFDDGHYRAAAGLVRGVRVSALAHYIACGQDIALCPVPGIDLEAFGSTLPELSVARLHPYRHIASNAPEIPTAELDMGEISHRLARVRAPDGPPEISIVMPVHKNRAVTLNAICHVLEAQNEIAAELIVINDAAPDKELAEDLRDLALRGLLTLHEFDQNRGFVAATNFGMRLAATRDVVWLNSDTEVYGDWLDRLAKVAYSAPRIATVTPLSNNGTICSYPRRDADNPGELELDWRSVDRLAAQLNAGIDAGSPTAVGFACYVRRDAIRAVGELDEKAFGLGYGEENDFSQRALALGWSNRLAAI